MLNCQIEGEIADVAQPIALHHPLKHIKLIGASRVYYRLVKFMQRKMVNTIYIPRTQGD